MNIFRRLHWQLTLSYTLVTVCAFLVITLILGGALLTRIFVPAYLIPPVEKLIVDFRHQNTYNLITGWLLLLRLIHKLSICSCKTLNRGLNLLNAYWLFPLIDIGQWLG
jgi:hypothetical protein